MNAEIRPATLRLLIVDDHSATRQGLRLRLRRELDLLVVGEAATAHDAISQVSRPKPDVVLVDMSLPDGDGIDLLSQLGAVLPDVHCVVLTLNDAAYERERARQNGASAFVGKHEPTQVLLQAIRGCKGSNQ